MRPFSLPCVCGLFYSSYGRRGLSRPHSASVSQPGGEKGKCHSRDRWGRLLSLACSSL